MWCLESTDSQKKKEKKRCQSIMLSSLKKSSHLASHGQWGNNIHRHYHPHSGQKEVQWSKAGNRKTATMDFVNGVFLSPPYHQRQLIMLINLLCYLSLYRQTYSDSLKKERHQKWHSYKMLFSQLFAEADPSSLYCVVLSGTLGLSPLFFQR